MRLRRLWPAAVLVLAPVLAACSDDGDPDTDAEPTTSATPTADAPSPTPTPTPTPSATETTSEASAEPPAADRPATCDLLTDGDVSKALGVTVAAGKPAGEAGCTFVGKGTVTVRVEVTDPGTCPQPDDSDGNVEPSQVAGATTSWWKTSSAPPLVALQRACAKDANVDVALTYATPSYDGDPSAGSAQLAGLVLASLQG